MKKVDSKSANWVLANMVNKYFFDDVGRPKSANIEDGTFSQSGKEVIVFTNGQKYVFTIELK